MHTFLIELLLIPKKTYQWIPLSILVITEMIKYCLNSLVIEKISYSIITTITVPFLLHNTIQAEAFVLDFNDLPQGDIVSSQF